MITQPYTVDHIQSVHQVTSYERTMEISDGNREGSTAQVFVIVCCVNFFITEQNLEAINSTELNLSFIYCPFIAILVDWTNPYLVLTDLGQQTNGATFKNPQSGDKIYQYDPSTLVARWNATDPQSGIHNVRYYVGTHPYTADVQLAKLTSKTSIASNDVLPEATGRPNILHLSVFNRAGVETFLIAPGITIDTLLPNTDRLHFTCTKYVVTSIDSLVCSWFGAYDQFSGVNGFQILLGNEEIDATYYYEYLSSRTFSVTIRNFHSPLVAGNLVYTLNVINSVGLSNHVFAPLTVDDTPPIPQFVFVLTDQTYTFFLPTGEANSTTHFYGWCKSRTLLLLTKTRLLRVLRVRLSSQIFV